jgi:hypothetical protein
VDDVETARAVFALVEDEHAAARGLIYAVNRSVRGLPGALGLNARTVPLGAHPRRSPRAKRACQAIGPPRVAQKSCPNGSFSPPGPVYLSPSETLILMPTRL